MDEFLKMDIFFVVATISVVALSFFAAFVLWRLERVLKNIEHISGQIALESDSFRKDLADMRDEIRQGKGRLKSLFAFLGSFVKKPAKKSKS